MCGRDWTEGKPRSVGDTRVSGVSPKAAATPATPHALSPCTVRQTEEGNGPVKTMVTMTMAEELPPQSATLDKDAKRSWLN